MEKAETNQQRTKELWNLTLPTAEIARPNILCECLIYLAKFLYFIYKNLNTNLHCKNFKLFSFQQKNKTFRQLDSEPLFGRKFDLPCAVIKEHNVGREYERSKRPTDNH